MRATGAGVVVSGVLALVAAAAGASDAGAEAWRLPAAARVVAIGDLHGDLDATRRVLRLAGAIDGSDRWIGGDLVVVQTGDQLDRGDGEREILHLLDDLSGQARAAGGALHVLNGNHELMNAALDLRYVTEGGFAAFEELAPAAAEAELAGFAAEQRGRVAAFRPGGPYASRLAERPVILMVGDTLFCHGGVLPHHLDYGVDRINGETSAWLRGETGEPEWLADREDPVWTRRYSDAPDTDACATLDEVLERVGAERLVVGHTVQEGGVAAFCDGRVWCIDVGMAAAYGGEPQALEIRGDAVRVLGAAPVVAE